MTLGQIVGGDLLVRERRVHPLFIFFRLRPSTFGLAGIFRAIGVGLGHRDPAGERRARHAADPDGEAPVIRRDENGEREMLTMRWGYRVGC